MILRYRFKGMGEMCYVRCLIGVLVILGSRFKEGERERSVFFAVWLILCRYLGPESKGGRGESLFGSLYARCSAAKSKLLDTPFPIGTLDAIDPKSHGDQRGCERKSPSHSCKAS